MQIEHDPKQERDDWITRAQARDKWFPITVLGVVSAGAIARTTNTVEFSLDFIVFCGFLALMAWLLWPSSRKKSND